jgi:AraC-like DNA-binding protein
MVDDKQMRPEPRETAMVNFARAAALQGFAETAAEAGVDAASLCEAAGIPRAALTDPELRIRCDALGAVLDLAAHRTGIDDFALRMARARWPSTWGAAGLLMSQQETLGQALGEGARYITGHSEEVQIEIETWGEETAVWIDVDQAAHTMRFDPAQRNELLIGGAVFVVRGLLGREWRPLAVGFTHAARGDTGRYQPYFGCIPDFDQDRLYFLMDSADLDIPLPSRDPGAEPILRRMAEAELPDKARPVSRAVSLAVSQRLGEGEISAQSVAHALGLDLRTLQRRLAAEDANFSELLHAVRLNLAKTFVESSRRPLAEVADLLGFSSLSAFSQWYSRAHGQSAAERRAAGPR